MLPIIIVTIIATALIIGAYQLLINKYYWGPKGRPEKNDSKKESRQKQD